MSDEQSVQVPADDEADLPLDDETAEEVVGGATRQPIKIVKEGGTSSPQTY